MPVKNPGVTDFAKDQLRGVADPTLLKMGNAVFGTAKNLLSVFKTAKNQETTATIKVAKATKEKAKVIDEETKIQKKKNAQEKKEISDKDKEKTKEKAKEKDEEKFKKKNIKDAIKSRERGLKDFGKDQIESILDPFVLNLSKAMIGTTKNIGSKLGNFWKSRMARMALGGGGAGGGGGSRGPTAPGGGLIADELKTYAAAGGAGLLGGGLIKGLGKSGRFIGKRIPLLSGLIAGGTEYAQSGDTRKALTIGAGSGLGSLGGMKAGAMVGSIFGPFGTAIGGAAGAIIGGLFGEKAGQFLDKNKEDIDKWLSSTSEMFKGLTDNLAKWGETLLDWGKSLADKAKNVKDVAVNIFNSTGSAEGAGSDMIDILKNKKTTAEALPGKNAIELGMPGVGTYKPKGTIPGIGGEADTKEMIKRHEGLRLQSYMDTTGNATIGYGHKIKAGENFAGGITKEQADALFEQDYAEHKAAAAKNIPGFDKMSPQQQAAMTDLTFNMGPNWIDKWPQLKQQLAAGDFKGAAGNLQNSMYAKQVGGRSAEIAGLLGGTTVPGAEKTGVGFGAGAGYKLTGEEAKWFSGDVNKLAGVNPELVEKMKAASESSGKQLPIMSGYRSTEHQRQLWEKSDKTGKMVAAPGKSMHEVGEAVDLTQGWLKKNPDVVAALQAQGVMRPMGYEDWHIQREETRGKKAADIRAMMAATSNKPGDQIEQFTKQIGETGAEVTAANLDNQQKLLAATAAVGANTATAMGPSIASISNVSAPSIGQDKGDFSKDIDSYEGMMSIFMKNLTYGV